MSSKTWRRAAAGVLVLATVFGGGAWVRSRQSARERAEGMRVAREAADLSRLARAAGSADHPDEAARLLDRAVRLLRGARGTRGTPFSSLLIDLAALRLTRNPQDPAARASARALLEEARRVAGSPAELRARIARDLGFVCLLDGAPQAAEAWYAEALRLQPSDPEARKRLQLLRETRSPGLAVAR